MNNYVTAGILATAIHKIYVSIECPDLIIMQGHYYLQYKHSVQKGSGLVHRPDWN